MDEVHRRFAANVRRYAQERGITLTHLPDFASVGRSHFWAVMNGSRSPTLQWMTKLAHALGVDIEVLMRGSPPDPVGASGRRATRTKQRVVRDKAKQE